MKRSSLACFVEELSNRDSGSREAIPSLRFPEGGMFLGTQEKKGNKIPRICSRYLQATHSCQFITESLTCR
ncbi:hypothetical protein CEXT_71631 [Caerostris extrusa]|uniref:Ycf15 n=1 Tax=Caerostris extrusa TaxID=172846 RepID=A0AAV4XKR1_CAEEX|nr:hypothetical protein CEXT_71631 [Caerostris extrusa]